MPTQIETGSIPCSACHYPVQKPGYLGQQVKCPYCNTINEAIAQSTVTTPTAILIGIFSFIGGTVLGHAALISARGGSEYLTGKAEKRFGKK
jgi:phage FluMu protein Com